MAGPVVPNFICPGAQKAGTTSLYEMLRNHDDIFLPKDQKEIHFFDRDTNYTKGVDWYAQHYAKAEDQTIIGDISPDYMLFNYVPERIHKTLGAKTKLLFLLRHPVDRAYSQYNYHRFFQVENNHSFEQALEADAANVPEQFGSWHTPPYYVYKSLYFQQLSQFLELFPGETIHILIFEALFDADTSRSTRESNNLFDFLEARALPNLTPRDHANPTFVPKNPALFDTIKAKIAPRIKRFLSTKSYTALRAKGLQLLEDKEPDLLPETRHRLLKTYFMDDIKQLEDVTSLDLSVWYA